VKINSRISPSCPCSILKLLIHYGPPTNTESVPSINFGKSSTLNSFCILYIVVIPFVRHCPVLPQSLSITVNFSFLFCNLQVVRQSARTYAAAAAAKPKHEAESKRKYELIPSEPNKTTTVGNITVSSIETNRAISRLAVYFRFVVYQILL